MVKLAMLSTVPPELVSVTIFAALLVEIVWLPKSSDASESDATGGTNPVPFKFKTSGLFAESWVMVSVPV
jgi:hypothetical protein